MVRRPTRRLSPGATPGTKMICLNERFVNPGVYEISFGTSIREICEGIGGGMRDGREMKALQIGGPLAGILPASLLDTPFDFDQLAAEGCMVGHGGIVAFDDRTDMRALASHLLHFGTSESCGKCFPCRIGLRRAFEMVEAEGPVDRDRAGGPAGDARGREPVRTRWRHAGADPQSDQAFSRRAGGELGMEVFVDGVAVEVEPGTTALEAAKLADRWVPTLCLDDRMAPFGACRVCLVEIEGGRGAGGVVHDRVPRWHEDLHPDRARPPGRRQRRVAGAVRASGRSRPAYRACPRRRASWA